MHCLIRKIHCSTACIFWCTFDAQFKTFITLEGMEIFQSLRKVFFKDFFQNKANSDQNLSFFER